MIGQLFGIEQSLPTFRGSRSLRLPSLQGSRSSIPAGLQLGHRIPERLVGHSSCSGSSPKRGIRAQGTTDCSIFSRVFPGLLSFFLSLFTAELEKFWSTHMCCAVYVLCVSDMSLLPAVRLCCGQRTQPGSVPGDPVLTCSCRWALPSDCAHRVRRAEKPSFSISP